MAENQTQTTWTPELREQFREHVNAFFDEHGLRQGLSDQMSEFWDTQEGDELKKAMSEAQSGRGTTKQNA